MTDVHQATRHTHGLGGGWGFQASLAGVAILGGSREFGKNSAIQLYEYKTQSDSLGRIFLENIKDYQNMIHNYVLNLVSLNFKYHV